LSIARSHRLAFLRAIFGAVIRLIFFLSSLSKIQALPPFLLAQGKLGFLTFERCDIYRGCRCRCFIFTRSIQKHSIQNNKVMGSVLQQMPCSHLKEVAICI
jgi:hypothetical protein